MTKKKKNIQLTRPLVLGALAASQAAEEWKRMDGI